jgi:hypothetical protein
VKLISTLHAAEFVETKEKSDRVKSEARNN